MSIPQALSWPAMCLRIGICLCSLLGLTTASQAEGEALLARARSGMRKGGAHWAEKVASHGGYVWEYSTDFVTRRRGESGDLPLSTVWVQAGTPLVGQTFLRAYEVTGEPSYLDAAVAAGHCLAWGQLKSGGWTYSIEFDLERNRAHYHHLDGKDTTGKKLRDTTTFDDDNTQSATRFLMALDQHVDDPVINQALARAWDCFLAAQYEGGVWDGAWPQRFPPPTKGYGRFPTFNDNTMSDCVRTMLTAYRQYGKAEHLDSVRRCLDFYLRSQQPEPQGAWAQQYDEQLKPAWARRFEPPSVTGAESCGNARLLLDMFVEFGDARCLDAVRKAVEWYKRSRIGGTEQTGVWARFYELQTNKPLYFTRTYELVYTDDDVPVHYSFKGGYGVNTMMARYEKMCTEGRQHFLDLREHTTSPAEWAAAAERVREEVTAILDGQDELGRWVKVVARREGVRDAKGRYSYVDDEKVKLSMMYTRTFVRNVRVLSNYICAAQGGPKVVGKAEPR